MNAYSQDFVDQAKCKEIALDQIARGAHVIFQVAGQCGLGALSAAKEKNVRGIGVDADQSYLGAHVLTSALKKVDVAVYETVQSVQDGSFSGGKNSVFDVASGAVGLGKIASDVPSTPGPGVVHHFHCEAPSTGSSDSTNPRVGPPGVSPPMPTSTCLRITIGADVDQFDTSSPVSFRCPSLACRSSPRATRRCCRA